MSWSLYDWERSTWDSSQETKITTCINTHTWCKLECNPQRGQKWKRTKDLGLDFLEAPPTTTHHQKRQKEKVSFCVYSAFSSDVTSRKHSCPEIWTIAPSYRLSSALSYGLIPYLPLSLVCEHTMVRHQLPLHIIRTQKMFVERTVTTEHGQNTGCRYRTSSLSTSPISTDYVN